MATERAEMQESFLPANCGANMEIKDNEVICKKVYWNSAHGNVRIDASKYPNAIYAWKIRVNECICGVNVAIGITTTRQHKNASFYVQNKMGSYLYSHYGYVHALDKKLTTKTQKWENNDIITMIVNMKEQRILFYKNNKYMTKIVLS